MSGCVLICLPEIGNSYSVGPHRLYSTHTRMHTHTYIHTAHAYTQTRFLLSSLLALSPLLSHYLTPINYVWITQEPFHQLVCSHWCFCTRPLFLSPLRPPSPRSCSTSPLYSRHTAATASTFLSFFFLPSLQILLGCFTQLRVVCVGSG